MPSEKETRASLIDRELQIVGWAVDDSTQVVRVFRIESPSVLTGAEPDSDTEGLQISDYVLLGRNGRTLAVVEAKKSSVDAAIGREQAKQYCSLTGCQNAA